MQRPTSERIAEADRVAELPGLLDPPLRRFVNRLALALMGAARLRSPFRTGRLQDSIQASVDTGVPLAGAVVASNVNDYPVVLEESARHHYRATNRAGQPTRLWFSGSVDDVAPEVEGWANDLGQELGELWPEGEV